MGDNSLQRQAKVKFPIEGMRSVVATVTGYVGIERFNIIKLISKAGASYVGSMNQSTTHLICWKYEGRKYELAKRLEIKIVNHQWVEDCIKKGRRLPEYSYTFQCGCEVGPLLLNISLIADTSELEINKSSPKIKTNKGSPRSDKSFGRRYGCEEPLSPEFLRLEKRNCTPVQSSGKSRKRRLVKKETRVILELSSDSEKEGHPESDFREHDATAYFPEQSDFEGHEGLCNSSLRENGSSGAEALNDFIKNVDVDDVLGCEEQIPHLKGSTTPHVRDVDTNVNGNDGAAKLPSSAEFSCVICWTEFSASRGVLPCGHRFCCPCIRSWADHMNSSGKISTCPLCKTIFEEIIEVEDAVSSDQKIYTQTIPDADVRMVHVVPGVETLYTRSDEPQVCCVQCNCREPEDLLISCHICQRHYIHNFCLDPPMDPWACSDCRGLRRLLLSN